ncbi:MAG TPA: polysaccharide deacetylase family protein, partial [Burkholderiaceae bacterium]|nr:polysaccharide deacetylase family protein [Burkholderiaceae bacterium]
MGFDFLARRLEATVVEPLAVDSEEWFLLPYGDTPATRGLRAGERLWLTKVPETPLRVSGGTPVARFGDWARLTLQPNARAAAATLSERDGGRTAYLGFAETSWTASQAAIDRLVADTIAWLARVPAASLAAWPGTHRAAFVVEMDTEDRFENARWFAELLDRQRLRGTFYSLTSQARRHPELVAALAARHEIAYHADVHDGFKGLPEPVQRARLDAMIAELRPLLPAGAPAPRGFRAPLESYDATTERLLRALGLGHHAASPASRDDVLPGFSRAEDGVPTDAALVVLPRTMLDDVNWLKLGLLERSVQEPMLAAYADSVAMRGLGLLSVHSQNFAPGGVLHVELPALLEALARDRDRVWVATGGEIERWWRDPAAGSVETERAGADGLRVRVAAARAVPAVARRTQSDQLRVEAVGVLVPALVPAVGVAPPVARRAPGVAVESVAAGAAGRAAAQRRQPRRRRVGPGGDRALAAGARPPAIRLDRPLVAEQRRAQRDARARHAERVESRERRPHRVR